MIETKTNIEEKCMMNVCGRRASNLAELAEGNELLDKNRPEKTPQATSFGKASTASYFKSQEMLTQALAALSTASPAAKLSVKYSGATQVSPTADSKKDHPSDIQGSQLQLPKLNQRQTSILSQETDDALPPEETGLAILAAAPKIMEDQSEDSSGSILEVSMTCSDSSAPVEYPSKANKAIKGKENFNSRESFVYESAYDENEESDYLFSFEQASLWMEKASHFLRAYDSDSLTMMSRPSALCTVPISDSVHFRPARRLMKTASMEFPKSDQILTSKNSKCDF